MGPGPPADAGSEAPTEGTHAASPERQLTFPRPFAFTRSSSKINEEFPDVIAEY